MIFHIGSDASYLSVTWSNSHNEGNYYLIALPTNLEKSPNLPPPENGPILMKCRILKHMLASAAKAEVGILLHNGQTSAPLRITLQELGFLQQQTSIKTDNSVAEGIVTRSKAMDMRFYLMKDGVKQKEYFVYWKAGSQNMGNTSHKITHHITTGEFVLRNWIYQMTYLNQS